MLLFLARLFEDSLIMLSDHHKHYILYNPLAYFVHICITYLLRSVKLLVVVIIDFKRYPRTPYCLMQGSRFICSNLEIRITTFDMRKWVIDMQKWVIDKRKCVIDMQKWVIDKRKWVIDMQKWAIIREKWINDMRNKPLMWTIYLQRLESWVNCLVYISVPVLQSLFFCLW